MERSAGEQKPGFGSQDINFKTGSDSNLLGLVVKSPNNFKLN